MAQNISRYEHFVKDARTNPAFPDGFRFHRVESIEQLKEILKEPRNLMGFDIEATGLSALADDIVSFSFAFSEYEGYNVPCFHDPSLNNGNPGLGEEALDLIYEYMTTKAKTVAIHNFSYECTMMEWHGFTSLTKEHQKMWMDIRPYEDEIYTDVCINQDEVLIKPDGQMSLLDPPEVLPIYEKRLVKTPFPKERVGKFLKYDMSKVHYFDTMISCWLSDTNDPGVGLKKYEEKLLGWRSASFKETLGDNYNFKFTDYTDPKVTQYTCLDAMGAVGLAKVTKKYYDEANVNDRGITPGSGKNDMDFIFTITRMCYTLQRLDTDRIKAVEVEARAKLEQLENKLYEMAGERFNIKSPKEKQRILIKNMKITCLPLSKTSADRGRTVEECIAAGEGLSTSKLALNSVIGQLDPDQAEFVKTLLRFSATSTLYNNFIKNLMDAGFNHPIHPGYGRFNFRTTVAATGRLSAQGDRNGTKWNINVNVQNQPKPYPTYYHTIHIDEAPKQLSDLFHKEDGTLEDIVHYQTIVNGEPRDNEIIRILNYLFCKIVFMEKDGERYPDDFPFENEGKEPKMIEGMNQDLNIRSMYLPYKDDFYIMSLDYSGQELKVVALMSQEPVWMNAFTRGEDAHKATAMQILCHDGVPYNKKMRMIAKSLNFGIIYGRQPYSIWQSGVTNTIEEAEDFYRRFREGLPTLFKYLDGVASEGKNKGTVKTMFGRPRRVKYWVESDNPKYKAFGMRTCYNSPIQGSGSDLIKLSINRIYRDLIANPKYTDDLKWHCTVHDEVNYSVRKSRAAEIGALVNRIMTFRPPGAPFPFDTSIGFGLRWGQLFDFYYDKTTFELTTPKWEDIGERPEVFKVEPSEEKEAVKPKSTLDDIEGLLDFLVSEVNDEEENEENSF
mgnify:CR=1 FL=1